MNVPRLPDAIARASRDDEAARYQVDLNRYLSEQARAPLVQSGNWTPTLVSWTGANPTVVYGTCRGRWVKVGTMVQVTGTITVTSVTGGTGNAAIGGLPFACSADQGGRGGFSLTWAQGFSSTTSPASAIPNVSSAVAPLFRRASADARDELTTQVAVSECVTPVLYFTGQYDAG